MDSFELTRADHVYGGPADLSSVEAFIRLAEILSLSLSDARAARVEELRDLGLNRLANRIDACADPSRSVQMFCRQRMCPACAGYRSMLREQELGQAIFAMTKPVFVTITLRSTSIDDLRPTIERWNTLMGELRRTAMWREFVFAGAGMREWKVTRSGSAWNVHGHVALDVADWSDAALQSWATQCATLWTRLTGGTGSFLLHPTAPRISTDDPGGVVAYFAKTSDTCPMPGAMLGRNLKILIESTRGVQLPIRWGTATGRRRFRPADDHVVVVEREVTGPSVFALSE